MQVEHRVRQELPEKNDDPTYNGTDDRFFQGRVVLLNIRKIAHICNDNPQPDKPAICRIFVP
jgi:hypothetical protein